MLRYVSGILMLLWVLSPLMVSCAKKSGDKSASPKERVFRIANGTETSSLDPALARDIAFMRIHQALFTNLTAFDPKTADPIPGLAERWEISPDGKTYTFILRPGLKWSDGAPLTAADFVYSWKRILNPALAANYAWLPASVIKGGQEYLDGSGSADGVAVRALDPQTFQVEFVAALPYILDMLNHQSFSAVPQHTVEKYGVDWTKPENYVSCGPYKMSIWLNSERLEVIPNPYYYRQEDIGLDKVVFLPIADAITAYNMFLNGEVDWVTEIPSDYVESLRNDPRASIAPYLGSYFFNFNLTNPVLSDLRVRQAMSMVINRRVLTQEVLRTGVIPTTRYVPPMPGYPVAAPYVEETQADIAKAQELLAAAGYPGGKGFPGLQLYYDTNENHKKVSEFLQEQWRTTLGINVELHNMEWKTFVQLRRAHEFDIARSSWTGDYRDPSTFLDLFTSKSLMNHSVYNSPQYDDLIQQAREMRDVSERMKLLNQAEDMLLKDHVFILLNFLTSRHMIDPSKWDGWYSNISDAHPISGIKPKS